MGHERTPVNMDSTNGCGLVKGSPLRKYGSLGSMLIRGVDVFLSGIKYVQQHIYIYIFFSQFILSKIFFDTCDDHVKCLCRSFVCRLLGVNIFLVLKTIPSAQSLQNMTMGIMNLLFSGPAPRS